MEMSEVENRCRACLETSKILIKFDDKMTKSEKVFECFQNLTSLELKSNKINSNICKKCFEKLKEACEFKELCLQNNKYWKLIDIGADTLSEVTKPELVILKQEEPWSYHDKYLVEEIKTEELLQDALKEENRSEEPKRLNKKEEDKSIEENVWFQKRRRRREGPPIFWICDICGSNQKNRWNMNLHMNRHIGIKNHVCDQCGRCYFTKQLLQVHTAHKHNADDKKHKCPHCESKFFLKHHLNKHMQAHRIEKNHQCIVCGNTFRYQQSLKNHLLTHGNTMDFQCQTCGKKFQNKSNLQIHIKGVHEAKPTLQCPICPVTLGRKSTLRNHIKRHTNPTKFPCMYCEKEFLAKSVLSIHVLSVHLNSTFACKLCEFQMPVKRCFQKTYINHVRETHKELTSQQLEFMEFEIGKLKIKNICPDLPTSLKGPKASTICDKCGINLFKLPLLEKHKESVHGIKA